MSLEIVFQFIKIFRASVVISGAAMETEELFVPFQLFLQKAHFYVGQTVQFTCETTSTRNISYQWNYNYHGHSNATTDQIINVTFDQTVIRYSWVLCTASSSGVTLGKTNRVIG